VKVKLDYLENLLNDPEAGGQSPAAVIVEVVPGEGGVIPADLARGHALPDREQGLLTRHRHGRTLE